MEKKYIMSLDQGTTSSRAIIFDRESNIIGMAQKEFSQIYPRPGWVEQDPMEIWGTQSGVAREVLEKTGISPFEIASIGIANQRETTILWSKKTGRPIYNAIGWQCRRTSDICKEIKKNGLEDYIIENTGLVLDAYFSGTKIKWILENVKEAKDLLDKGDLLFGTVDTWIVWNLTRGKLHISDYSNASRTMLFNIKSLDWDEKILGELNIPKSILPKVVESSNIYGYTDEFTFGGAKIPIGGIAGDQQAALFGQACFKEGMAKNTYGTGCFMLMNTGENIIKSKKGLLTTIAWGINEKVDYALEGSVFVAGAGIQWLRDELKIIRSADESQDMARRVDDTNGVFIVPAFSGLGAPYWDMYARGTIVGITRGVKAEHIVRATLEAIAYQTKDIFEAMEEDSNIKLKTLNVDGGAVVNNFLMEFQADILDVEVKRPEIGETTALGAAYLAGLAVGYWKSKEDIVKLRKIDRIFSPSMEEEYRKKLYRKWKKAVERSLKWEE